MKKIISLCLVAYFSAFNAVADDAIEAKVLEALKRIAPNVKADSVQAAQVPGLYEVVVGADVIYITSDGRYLIQGDVMDLESGVNLTEQIRAKGRQNLIASVDEVDMIIYSPENPKYTITVFTDIDCGYCRKLHRELESYNKLGITIRYMFHPNAGPGSRSYVKAENVWCSDDKNDALTRAKAGERVPDKSCVTPIVDHLSVARQLNVNGTPAIVLSDGTIVPGYVAADRLLGVLEEMK